MRRLVFALSTGVLATLLADCLMTSLLHPRPTLRWPVVIGIGVLAVLTTVMVSTPARNPVTRILTGIRARRLRVKRLRYKDNASGELHVLSKLSLKGDLDAKDVDIDRTGRQDA